MVYDIDNEKGDKDYIGSVEVTLGKLLGAVR